MSSEQFLDHFLTFKHSPADGPSELFPRSPCSLLPPSAEGNPVCPWKWGFIGEDGIPDYIFKMANNPRSLPEYPIQSLGVTPPLCLAGTEACIILEDISYSLLLAWRTDLKRGLSSYNPLELRWMKSRHTQRDLGHQSCRIFIAFQISLQLLLCPEKWFHMKKVWGDSANWAKTGRGFGKLSTALAHLAAAAGRMFHSEGLGWLL